MSNCSACLHPVWRLTRHTVTSFDICLSSTHPDFNEIRKGVKAKYCELGLYQQGLRYTVDEEAVWNEINAIKHHFGKHPRRIFSHTPQIGVVACSVDFDAFADSPLLAPTSQSFKPNTSSQSSAATTSRSAHTNTLSRRTSTASRSLTFPIRYLRAWRLRLMLVSPSR